MDAVSARNGGRRCRAILLAVLLLAGCLSPTTDEAPVALPSVPSTLWLTADAFRADPPTATEPTRVASGNFFAAWRDGEGLPTWRGGALPVDVLVTEARVVAWAETPRGAAQGGRFPSYIAYFGAAGFLQAQASLPPLGVVPPGDVRELVFDLALPRGGLVLPAGEALEVLLTPVQTNDDAADPIAFLVDAEATPSRVEIVATPVALPAPALEPRTTEATGRLVGTAYVGGSTHVAEHAIDVPAEATRVEVAMEVTSNAGVPDVDVTLLDEAGEEVAGSSTPYGREGVRLLAPNLDGLTGGRLAARVVEYGPATAEYRLVVTVG